LIPTACPRGQVNTMLNRNGGEPRQASQEGFAHPHLGPWHPAGEEARSADGSQPGDGRGDQDQSQQEDCLPGLQGPQGSCDVDPERLNGSHRPRFGGAFVFVWAAVHPTLVSSEIRRDQRVTSLCDGEYTVLAASKIRSRLASKVFSDAASSLLAPGAIWRSALSSTKNESPVRRHAPKADEAFCRIVAPARVREISVSFCRYMLFSAGRAGISRLCIGEGRKCATRGARLSCYFPNFLPNGIGVAVGLALCLFVGRLTGLRFALAGFCFLIV